MEKCPECGRKFTARDDYDEFCSSHCAWRWRRMRTEKEKSKMLSRL